MNPKPVELARSRLAAIVSHTKHAVKSYNPPMTSALNSICVFCGSQTGNRPEYAAAATQFGKLLAERGIRVVNGAGHVGLMGVLSDAALAAGGQVIGVIPQMLVDRELAHRQLTELRIVRSMHERKALMAELSDAFVALPGGMGTYEELCEVLTWAQLGIHPKPCGCLNVLGYFDPLAAMLDHAVREGFLRPDQRRILNSANQPEELLALLEQQSALDKATRSRSELL
jgi:uncharacterized protein (TIGR00730 family)